MRPWLREIAESHELPVPTLRTIDDRARWWLTPEALYEWTSRHSQVTRTVPPVVDSTLLSLGDLVESVSEQAGDLWVVPLQSAASDLSVTRVFAPGIAPVYFDEEYAIRSTSSDFFSIELRHPLL